MSTQADWDYAFQVSKGIHQTNTIRYRHLTFAVLPDGAVRSNSWGFVYEPYFRAIREDNDAILNDDALIQELKLDEIPEAARETILREINERYGHGEASVIRDRLKERYEGIDSDFAIDDYGEDIGDALLSLSDAWLELPHKQMGEDEFNQYLDRFEALRDQIQELANDLDSIDISSSHT